MEAAASYNLEAAIPFRLGGNKAVAAAASYDELTFDIFDQGSILVLVIVLIHWCLYQQ